MNLLQKVEEIIKSQYLSKDRNIFIYILLNKQIRNVYIHKENEILCYLK